MRVLFKCHRCLHLKASRASSRVLGRQCLINQCKILIPPLCNASFFVENVYSMVHAFTCAAVLPSQYIYQMTQFHGLGCFRQSMNGFSPTYLFSHIFHCLYSVPAKWVETACQQGCRSFNAGCCEEVKPSTLFCPWGGKCTS